MSASRDHTSSPVSRPVLLAFGAGQLGAQVFRDTPAVLLPLFMVTMLGVPPWLAGLTILGPKLWLIVCDPGVGVIADGAKARRGRTPFLAAGAVLTSLSFLALFSVTAYPSPWVAAAAIGGMFLVGSTAFSLFSVPYLAVASELSADPHERTRVLIYRMSFATLGVVVGVGCAQPLIFAFPGAAGWRVMAAVFAALCLASMATTAVGLRRVRLIGSGEAPPRLREQLASVAGNRPFGVLLATCFVQGVGQACAYSVIGFVFLYVLGNVGLILPFILVMSVGTLGAQPLWLPISRRLGKARTFVVCSLLWTALMASFILLHPLVPGGGVRGAPVLPMIGPLTGQTLGVLARALGLGVLNGGFLLFTLSLLTDTIDGERRRTGVAHEGMFSGVFSAQEKLTFAVGPLVSGLGLSLSGFASSTGGATTQTPGAIHGVLLLYSLIPAAFQLAGLAVFSRFGPASATLAAQAGAAPLAARIAT